MKKIVTFLSAGASAVAILALTQAVMASAAPSASAARPAATVSAARSTAVVISGIYYNSPGSDRGGNASLNAEWAQLHNTSRRAVTLTGWTLRDTAQHIFTFNSYRLKAHGFVKIHTGHGSPTRANRYWNHSWYIWNNTGDTATLRNAAGAFRTRCKYSDPSEDANFTSC
jgi:Lamin Tail Domain